MYITALEWWSDIVIDFAELFKEVNINLMSVMGSWTGLFDY